jgi:hypothetical protein
MLHQSFLVSNLLPGPYLVLTRRCFHGSCTAFRLHPCTPHARKCAPTSRWLVPSFPCMDSVCFASALVRPTSVHHVTCLLSWLAGWSCCSPTIRSFSPSHARCPFHPFAHLCVLQIKPINFTSQHMPLVFGRGYPRLKTFLLNNDSLESALDTHQHNLEVVTSPATIP